MARRIVQILCICLLAGCAVKNLDDHMSRWNSWVGTTKDDRVRELGIPTRCHQFKTGGEMCEWPYRTGIETVDTVDLSFDPRGAVCNWSYRGFYGERRSEAKCP